MNAVLYGAWTFLYVPIKNSILNSDLGNNITALKVVSTEIPETYITPNQTLIDILHYSINLDLYPEKDLLKGDVTITGLLKEKSMSEIDFNFYDGFKIHKIIYNGKTINEYKYAGTSISLPIGKSNSDTFSVRIVYEGTPQKKGFDSFVFTKYNGRYITNTLNEPVFASTWYPCNDKPDDKALVDISITNDSSEVSVSNGKLINVTTNGNRRTYHWKTLYPISTYLVCLYSANYKSFKQEYTSISKKKMEIEYYALPEHLEMAKNDYSENPDIMKFFEEKFGEYPFINEKYGVAEFMWQLGAMEHQTITGIGYKFLNGRKMFNDYYIHELAHQWWGDAVGLKSWKDIWLNEGFASYCEALYAEYKTDNSAYKSTMAAKFGDFRGSLYNPSVLFSETVYNKGAWILHMLRFEVGDSTFFKILREYYSKYKYSNASTNDFKDICEKVSSKNLKYFFKQWVYEGNDIIKLDYNYEIIKTNDNNKLKIKIQQIQNGFPVYKFPMEVLIKKNDGNEITKIVEVKEREHTYNFDVEGNISDVTLDPNKWLLAKIQKNNKL